MMFKPPMLLDWEQHDVQTPMLLDWEQHDVQTPQTPMMLDWDQNTTVSGTHFTANRNIFDEILHNL